MSGIFEYVEHPHIEQRKAAGPLADGGITVELRGGIYELARPFELTDKDSGSQHANHGKASLCPGEPDG